jgi:hypothetical protein
LRKEKEPPVTLAAGAGAAFAVTRVAAAMAVTAAASIARRLNTLGVSDLYDFFTRIPSFGVENCCGRSCLTELNRDAA